MAQDVYLAPFEGPEKLLEVWFYPSAADVHGAADAKDGRFGLRQIDRAVWEEMLAIVKCQILSVVNGREYDAYLLSESSFLVSPHKLILKTCGTTLNLLGLPRILQIAACHADMRSVHRCFYSRKSFMFPDRQLGPHREWKDEVCFLDAIFPDGSAYTVGKVNGDHWLLYIVGPFGGWGSPASSVRSLGPPDLPPIPDLYPELKPVPTAAFVDTTIEILMTHLSAASGARFTFPAPSEHGVPDSSEHGLALSDSLGITSIFPPELTTLDAYAFMPCGYSSNALIKWGTAASATTSEPQFDGLGGEGYYTIHVTPEEGWSYASFECNVPLRVRSSPSKDGFPDLQTLVRRVVDIFEPGKITLTLFLGSSGNDDLGTSSVDDAHKAFKAALRCNSGTFASGGGKSFGAEGGADQACAGDGGVVRAYRRTDKINYELDGYDLAFASFELCA